MNEAAVADAALRERLLEQINGCWTTQALGVAATLGLAQRLEHRPRPADELAADIARDRGECHAPSLRRLLRALAALGVVEEGSDNSFALAPAGRLMLPDAAGSVHGYALMRLAGWRHWGQLLTSVRTGTGAREREYGRVGFPDLDADAEAAQRFHRGVAELTRRVAPALVQELELSGTAHVLDIGGGNGELLMALAHARPELRGDVVDLVHARAGALARIEAEGLGARCGFIEGSFFEPLPGGAQALLLKSVLHNWSDADAGRILAQCRDALDTPGARLAIVERVAPERLRATDSDRKLAESDLNMLVHLSGRERTQGEFDALLGAARLVAAPARTLAAGFSLIEARPCG